jgi:hypothetical protein
VRGRLADRATQREIRDRLDGVAGWSDWTAGLAERFGLRPVVIGPGLGVTRDDGAARLVGLAVSIFRDGVVPPYAIGGEAVTEVSPSGGSSSSHSENDLPAPPHCAGFFEPVPPMALLFACVRPHPGGGAETTVTDLPRLLERADPGHLRAWRDHPYRYRTSRRLGGTEHPLRILRTVDGRPFLRYRREYTVTDEEGRPALDALDALLAEHAWKVHLAPDEVLVQWNGAPHGRLAQRGPTPSDPARRRRLLRCRVEPAEGWADRFEGTQAGRRQTV